MATAKAIPATDTATPAPAPAPKKRRGVEISAEARERGRETRHMSAVFNKYLKRLAKGLGPSAAEELSRLKEQLASGLKLRACPRFERVDGKSRIVGTEKKLVPLLPADRAKMMQRVEDLEGGKAHKAVKPDLRTEFLQILRPYAQHRSLSLKTLQAIGIPTSDLIACGFIPKQ